MSEVAVVETGAPDATEARARRLGWRPEAEYNGRREWVPAEKFIETAENELPVLRENLRKLDERYVKDLGDVNKKLTEQTEVLRDFREFASRGEQRAYERARKELLEKRDVAVAHADTETFKQIDGEIAELDKTVKPEAKTEVVERQANTAPAPDPAITSWIAENSWFSSDKELHAYAKSQDAYLIEAKPGLSVAERLAEVKNRTRKEFPDKFGNTRREEATSVAAPGETPSRTRRDAKSYENLPPEAKAACDKYVKTIPNYKREDYVRDYDWT